MATGGHLTAEQALRKYGDSVLRLAYSYLHNLPDAEDVVQDTLLRLIDKDPLFASDEHAKAWLLRVAINLSKNKLRSAWSKRQELEDSLPAAERDEGEEAVMQAVSALPVKYKEVVHLFYYEGYSTAEIAALLKKNESTIRSLLHRARGLLRELLKEEYDFHE